MSMALETLRAMDGDWLNADQVADLLMMPVQRVRNYARQGKLPFPVRESGNRFLFGRIGMIRWLEGDQNTADVASKIYSLLKEIKATLEEINERL